MQRPVKINQLLCGIALTASALGWQAAAAKGAPEYVKPPLKLNAALIVSDDMMVGPGFKMDPVAVNDGYSNTYTLTTDVGEVKVVSDYQLARQIQEGGASSTVGWAGTKRAYALELGADPHTEWEPLKEALTSVSRAAFAGGIAVGLAMDAVAQGTIGTIVTVTSLSEDMNAILLDNPPEGLTKINRKKLKDMGVPKDVFDPFLLNYNYTPMEKTLLVEALNRMQGTKGRELFIAHATAAPDKVMARYFQQAAEMMAHYHTKVQATDIVKIDNEIWQVNRKGTLVGAFPIDYLAWTADASTIARGVEKSPKAKTRELWLEGSASPEARKGLTARGWKVNERVGFLTGKPLQEQTAAGAGMGATGAAIGVMR